MPRKLLMIPAGNAREMLIGTRLKDAFWIMRLGGVVGCREYGWIASGVHAVIPGKSEEKYSDAINGSKDFLGQRLPYADHDKPDFKPCNLATQNLCAVSEYIKLWIWRHRKRLLVRWYIILMSITVMEG